MGEVYRARDTRLGRDVAVKVLPQSFAADADRLRRFEQEACAAGALNHPGSAEWHSHTHMDLPGRGHRAPVGADLEAGISRRGLGRGTSWRSAVVRHGDSVAGIAPTREDTP